MKAYWLHGLDAGSLVQDENSSGQWLSASPFCVKEGVNERR